MYAHTIVREMCSERRGKICWAWDWISMQILNFLSRSISMCSITNHLPYLLQTVNVFFFCVKKARSFINVCAMPSSSCYWEASKIKLKIEIKSKHASNNISNSSCIISFKRIFVEKIMKSHCCYGQQSSPLSAPHE
mgnify:CR=1 FL=1